MAKLYNRARMTVTSTGTGTLTLGTNVAGYQTFSSSGAQTGDVVSYVIEDSLNWEIGTGTYNSSSGTLTRTVTQSYNGTSYGTSAISVTTSAQVFISPLAADLQAGTSAGNLVQLDGSAKLPAVDGSNLTNVKTPPGGTTGQVQYNAGSNTFGGFTVSGDGTLNTSTGALTVTKTSGTSFGALATTTPGTGVATALGANVGSAGSFVVNGGALGTPSSGTLTNCTGLPSAGVTGLAASATTDTTNASNISSGTLAVARGGSGATATTGTGNNVLATSPVLATPAIIGSSTGTTTIASANSGATNYTLTLPAKTGNIITSADSGTVTQTMMATGVASVGPAFSAYANASQTPVSSDTWTKIALQAEDFDTANCFDSSTNYRFTPNVAGYYQINGVLYLKGSGTSTTQGCLAVYKNGSTYSRLTDLNPSAALNSNTSICINGCVIVYLNGSTDYVELYGYYYLGTCTFSQASNSGLNSRFTGALVRAA